MNQPFRALNLLRADKASSVASTVSLWQRQGLSVGIVPTMGALHAGHLSLVERALQEVDRVVVSIFVNPTQFSPDEDFEAYPRNIDADCMNLQHVGAHMVYTPSIDEVYPDGQECNIKAGEAAQGLEGDMRPTHFDGVVNVLCRLFDQIKPCVAVFGEKDFQQLQVIKEMVEAEDMPIKIISAPIVRDEHGLALSSRNVYLNKEELEIARQLNKILKGPGTPEEKTQALLEAGFDKVDYVAQRWGRILAAAYIGKTRLIDNMVV